MRTLAQIARTSGVTFGTSGARGLVSALTADVCQAYVSAFLQTSALSAPAVLLGCDLRPSSLALVRRCAAARLPCLALAGKCTLPVCCLLRHWLFMLHSRACRR